MSLRALEEETRVSAATLSRIERGRAPDLPAMERLARWLGVDVCVRGSPDVSTSEPELARTIEGFLRTRRGLPEEVARAVAEALELVIALELRRRDPSRGAESPSRTNSRKRERGRRARGRDGQ
jgi:transcriptional regulator with XRE-family HTH domain